jgi:magnesium transporter
MDPNVYALPEELTAGEAITALQTSRDVEMVFYLYVVDERRHLVGVVSLRRLLLVPPETPLKRIMTIEVYSARVDTDQEEVARMVASYNLLAIPVVDRENKLVGVITVDDVIDVIKDEATEDVYRLAGVSADDGVLSPPRQSLQRRLPWLVVNLATAFLAASVVGLFRDLIAEIVLLAIFMPVVAGMGGNAATQTLAVVVRGLALGELTWSNARQAVFKEGLVGLGNGVSNGLLGAVAVWVVTRVMFGEFDWALGFILMAAMVINMFVAAVAGTLIPLGLRALKVDPALASSVFITTLTDVFGFLSFLGLGFLFSGFLK